MTIPRRHELVIRQRPHRTAPEHPQVHTRQSHLGILHPPSTCGCPCASSRCFGIIPDDMSAIYGPNSSRPSTPTPASSLTEILLPCVCLKGATRTMRNAEKCIFFLLFLFFTLLPTWAVREIPSSHRTLCRHIGTHGMSLRLSTLLLNTLCVHRASTPGAHG